MFYLESDSKVWIWIYDKYIAHSAYIEPTIYFNYNASNTTGEYFIDIANVSRYVSLKYNMDKSKHFSNTPRIWIW